MPDGRVETIRRNWDHWLATGELRVADDLVWDVSRLGWPDQQVYIGAEGGTQFNEEWAAAWDDWEVEPVDFIEAGERVVVILHQRGRAKTSGVPVEMGFAQVWEFRDGRAVSMHLYANPDQALHDVGLSP
jgi:ketosteroid isomerase-like protein